MDSGSRIASGTGFAGMTVQELIKASLNFLLRWKLDRHIDMIGAP